LAALDAHFPRAGAVFGGEPTNMRVGTGHKGGFGVVTRLRGKAAHSSMPALGVSAIAYAGELLAWHQTQMQAARERADPASNFNPPHTTVQVGTIRGGAAANIVPDDCVIESDIRFMPDERAEDWVEAYRAEAARIEQRMQAEHPEASVTLSGIEVIPAVAPEADGAAEALARQLTGDNSDNTVSYQTEAGHFQAAGYSTVVCGPGSIAQAHQPDEFISAEELRKGQDFMTRLTAALS
jgi:acetylornithine deacetylase